MAAINKSISIGFVGGDPIIVNFDNGLKKVTFSVGVEAPNGSEEPLWTEVHLWRKAAEVAEKMVKVGKLIRVSGRLQIESWQCKKTGAVRSKPIILGDSFTLLDRPKAQENF
ncbi:single-stranded DNA-binding protein (plasmid) [Calothrix sp. PCC 7716]|nr:single-stranded DNA-binding protein [Calothrix sp. PCC 7716]